MGPIAANETPLKKTFVPLRGAQIAALPGRIGVKPGSDRGHLRGKWRANGEIAGIRPTLSSKTSGKSRKTPFEQRSPMHAVLACT